jgi:hypothetical protein
MNIWENLVKSFTTEKGGFAARKLTAFSLMICIAFVHIRHCTPENAVEFLAIDLIGVLLCLAIVTGEQIIMLKNGNPNGQNNTTEN